MRKRVLGIIVSVLLAAGGTFVLVQYVGSADTRALAGQEATPVLVVIAPVAAGATPEELTGSVEQQLIPTNAQALDSVSTLTGLVGQVTSVDLVAGEQVLSTRFVTPAELAGTTEPELAPGLIEVTVSLSPERAVGGELIVGDLVTVFASFESSTIEPVADDADGATAPTAPAGNGIPSSTGDSTAMIIHNTLVTHIHKVLDPGESLPDASATDEDQVTAAPQDNILVTLGIEPAQAARLVFSSEFGTVWLGHETEAVTGEGPLTQTRMSIYDAIVPEVAP